MQSFIKFEITENFPIICFFLGRKKNFQEKILGDFKKRFCFKEKKGSHDKQGGVVWRVKRRSLAQNHKNTEANNYQTYVRNA